MKAYKKLGYIEMDVSQLDFNVPQVRGMIKWASFTTMSEQYERVVEVLNIQFIHLNDLINNYYTDVDDVPGAVAGMLSILELSETIFVCNFR